MNLKKIYNKKKILITGHTGFKGVWLTKLLNIYKCKLYGISLRKSDNDILYNKIKTHLNIKSYFFNISNYQKLNKTINKIKPNIIFHLAAQSLVIKSYKKKEETFNTNVLGSLNLIKSIENLKSLKKVFFITTDKVYLNKNNKIKFTEKDALGGEDPYSLSKVISDFIAQYYAKFLSKKIQCFILRAGNVIGGGDFAENRILADFYTKNKLIIRNPNSTRPFQFILDTLYKYLTIGAIKKNENSLIWNISPNKSFKVMEIINYLNKINNKKIIFKKNKIKEKKFLNLSNKKFLKKFKIKYETNIYNTLNQTNYIYKHINSSSDILNEVINEQITNYLKNVSK